MSGKKLTDQLIHQMTDEQRLALQELAEIAGKELKISRGIAELTDRVRKSHQALGFKTTSRPNSLCEDPEIEILVTAKARHKIENVREQIRRALKNAVDLGLSELGIIQRQAKVYGVPLEQKPNSPEKR